MSVVTLLAIIGGLTVAAALGGGCWYVWRWYRGATDLP